MAREYTVAEEQWHRATAGVGAAASLLALPYLIVAGVGHGDPLRTAGGAVFAICATLMFVTSALYHSAPPGLGRIRLRALDHSAIFLLIAGTYTPFTIGAAHSARGWALFGAVWTLALVGVIAKTSGRLRSTGWSSALYVGLGWIGVVNMPEIRASLTPAEFTWMLAGGLSYTFGVPFYVWKGRRFTHAVWHGFVIGGVACHFIAVLGIVTATAAR